MLPLILPLLLTMPPPQVPAELLTAAERSDYTATASSEEVLKFIDALVTASPLVRVTELGRTVAGQPIPLVILANPPVSSADEARAASAARGAPICFVLANIHAGEIEGKEASLMLARELALATDHPLLRDLIIVIAPNYNADGNDRFDSVEKNRPGQAGPARVGVRANAQDLDLNRDYIKLEAPETRALVKFLTEWDPHITIDCHTTNGSHHRYTLTYEAPLNPSGHPAPIDFVRNHLLPQAAQRVKESTGYDLWHYGNFNAPAEGPPTAWETYSALPRFGGPYQGLRGQMSVLSEAYSYAPYKDRVIATREFIREVLRFIAEKKADVLRIAEQARHETTERGRDPQPQDCVGIRHRIAALNDPVLVKGYEKSAGGAGGAVADPQLDRGAPRDYWCIHRGQFEPTLSVRRPFAYIIPPGSDRVLENLRQHGIEVEPFQGAATVEAYTITSITRTEQPFQGHRTVTLEARSHLERRVFPSSSHIVRTAQPLGTLAVYLLEPMSEDGLATWNFFDDALMIGGEFPVARVQRPDDLPAR